ncbi:MAG: hypothetical protein ACI89M_002120 [Chitinophagales bacterium]|jgi:hypothetical protein
MKTSRKITINKVSDKVWKVLAHDFDDAHKWLATIPNSYAADLGKQYDGATSCGRVCELDGKPNGMKAKESFVTYDEANKSFTILVEFINTPFGFPIVKNVVEFSVDNKGGDASIVNFTVTYTLKPLAFLILPILKISFRSFLGQVLEELKYYVENGTPHPRKIKALDKISLSS